MVIVLKIVKKEINHRFKQESVINVDHKIII